MPDSATPSSIQFPLEILLCIFRYLDVPDILRVRRVSRYLNQVSYARDVWSDAYRKADFVHPPGPFPSQSACDLESALILSFRVDRNLRHGGDAAQAERPTRKLKEIQYHGMEIRVTLVFGQFLLLAFRDEVRCYDLNRADSDASIVYRPTCGALKSFHCVSAVDLGGRPIACVVLKEVIQTTSRISIYSLVVGEQSDVTLDLLYRFERSAFDVNAVDLGPRVIVVRGRLPIGCNFDAGRDLVVIDVHTRTQLLLPPLAQAEQEMTEVPISLVYVSNSARLKSAIQTSGFGATECTLLTTILTSTHLLLAYSFYIQPTGWKTLIQAFGLLSSDTRHHFTPCPTLSLSHSSIIAGIYIDNTVLLHDSIRDPTTQDVLIPIRVHAFDPSAPNSSLQKHGTLRLSAARTIAVALHGPLGRLRVPFCHPSFNGAGRVFHALQAPPEACLGSQSIISVLEYDLRVGADGEAQAARVAEYPYILRFPTRRMLWDYDPYSGRLCLRSSNAGVNVIEILDLAV